MKVFVVLFVIFVRIFRVMLVSICFLNCQTTNSQYNFLHVYWSTFNFCYVGLTQIQKN